MERPQPRRRQGRDWDNADAVTAHAVASLPVLLEYTAPFCRRGGLIILPKKGDLDEELAEGKRAARQVGAILKADVPVTLPGMEDGNGRYSDNDSSRISGVLNSAFLCSTSSVASCRIAPYRSSRYW